MRTARDALVYLRQLEEQLSEERDVRGTLVGLDAKTSQFRFEDEAGTTYKGRVVGQTIGFDRPFAIPGRYVATIRFVLKTEKATGAEKPKYELVHLEEIA